MLLSCGLSILLFAGACVASVPDQNLNAFIDDKSKCPSNSNQSPVRFEDKMVFLPVNKTHQAFFSLEYIIPNNDPDHEPAYADIIQKSNSNGTVHYSILKLQDLFQGLKHSIDGNDDYNTLKNSVTQGFLDHGFINNYDLKAIVGPNHFKRNITKPCTVFFFGYQQIEPTDCNPLPIIRFDYNSYDELFTKSEHTVFVGLSVVTSLIGLYWLLRCLWRPKSLSFTQFLLLVWYSAFLVNHPIKRTFYSDEILSNRDISVLLPIFSSLFGDAFERPLFNSLVLALTLGMGYLRPSSKKLVFLILFLNWIQSLFIFFAPLMFPVLDFKDSAIASVLQFAWKLFNLYYIPFLLTIRMAVVYRMHCKHAYSHGDQYTKAKRFVSLVFLSIFVSIVIYVHYAPFYNTSREVLKCIVGTLFFQILAYCFSSYNNSGYGYKEKHLKNHIPTYKDDPEMNLSVYE